MYFIIALVLSFFATQQANADGSNFASVVVDGKSGKIIHSEKAFEIRHPASLTKKITLYLIFEALNKRKINLNTRFTVSNLAARQIPSKLGIKPGSTISVENIIMSLIIKSANDVAVVAAEGLGGNIDNFVKMMNKKAYQLGLRNTRFYNPSGVPDRRQVTTAYDMALLAMALHRDFPRFYHYFKKTHFYYSGKLLKSHNHMLKIPGVDGIKTGYTCASGFNISNSAVRYDQTRKPRRLFVVVMGGKTARSRDLKAANLLHFCFDKVLDGKIESSGKITPIKYTKSSNRRPDLESIIEDVYDNAPKNEKVSLEQILDESNFSYENQK